MAVGHLIHPFFHLLSNMELTGEGEMICLCKRIAFLLGTAGRDAPRRLARRASVRLARRRHPSCAAILPRYGRLRGGSRSRVNGCSGSAVSVCSLRSHFFLSPPPTNDSVCHHVIYVVSTHWPRLNDPWSRWVFFSNAPQVVDIVIPCVSHLILTTEPRICAVSRL